MVLNKGPIVIMIIFQFSDVMTDAPTSIADSNISTNSRMGWGLVPKREATKVKRKWFSYQRSNANVQQFTNSPQEKQKIQEKQIDFFLNLCCLLMHQGDTH